MNPPSSESQLAWRRPGPGGFPSRSFSARADAPIPWHKTAETVGLCGFLQLRAVSLRGRSKSRFSAANFLGSLDRQSKRLHERTRFGGRSGVQLGQGSLKIDDGLVEITLAIEETEGIEVVAPHGRQYVWTRKQAGVSAFGTVRIGTTVRQLEGLAVVDETAGYRSRHTAWHWSAGVGKTTTEKAVAWNLVSGINDGPRANERTL